MKPWHRSQLAAQCRWAQDARVIGAAQAGSTAHDCTRAMYQCPIPTKITVMYSFLVALLFFYFLGTAFYLRLAHSALRQKPYNQMRIGHQMLRLQVRAVYFDALALSPIPYRRNFRQTYA